MRAVFRICGNESQPGLVERLATPLHATILREIYGRLRRGSPPEMTCGFLTQLVFCKKKNIYIYTWFIGVEVEQETSAPPPKKILDPPLGL